MGVLQTLVPLLALYTLWQLWFFIRCLQSGNTLNLAPLQSLQRRVAMQQTLLDSERVKSDALQLLQQEKLREQEKLRAALAGNVREPSFKYEYHKRRLRMIIRDGWEHLKHKIGEESSCAGGFRREIYEQTM